MTLPAIIGDGGLPVKVYQAFAVLIALAALASVLSLRMLPNGAGNNAQSAVESRSGDRGSSVYKFAMIFGLALIMAALAILGHNCQLWFERGAWASTTIDGTLEMVRLNDDLMDRLRHVQLIHSVLELPFHWVSISVGFAAFALGSIFDEGRG
jgi:hypothetical protein